MDKRVVCLVVDRLRASALGPYGAAWCETPALNRLAAQSLVFDCAMVDCPQIDALYRSLWQGTHPMAPVARSVAPESVIERAGERGLRTVLATDEPAIVEHPLAAAFDDCVRIDSSTVEETADSIDATQFARFFGAALGCLEEAQQAGPSLLWLHAQGMASPWDAPLEFRNSLVEEDDPLPPTTAEIPDLMLPAEFDPDELLGIIHAYTGQVMLLDRCIAALMEQLEESRLAQGALLVVLGARGFPLGEHLRVGAVDEPLYGETVHVPLMLRFPDGLGALARSPALVQPGDVAATIGAWLEMDGAFSPKGGGQSLLPLARREAEAARQYVCMKSTGGQRAIRTPAWHLRTSPGDGDEQERVELYVKPDDRWEVNEVADRCPEVVAGLRAALAQFETAVSTDPAAPLPSLDDIMLTPAE